MNRFLTLLSLILISFHLDAQVVTLDPSNAGAEDAATLYFNAAEGNGELIGADKVYIHHGIVTNSPDGYEWSRVIGNWGMDDGHGLMTKVDGTDDTWKIEFAPSIREYFSSPESENIYRIAAVFRSADGNTKGTLAQGTYGWGEVVDNGDYFIDLNVENYLIINEPTGDYSIMESGESLDIVISSSNNASDLRIWVDNGTGYEEKASANGVSTLSYTYLITGSEDLSIKATATIDGEDFEEIREHSVYVTSPSPVAALPSGMMKGINYHDGDDTRVTLVLEAPMKDFVYVTGTFNSWSLAHEDFLMNKTADGELFWLELTDLVPGQEYLFQYFVNGEVTVPDPYADKIADPWNDQYIDESTYPGLLEYTRTQFGPASYLQTGQTAYQWSSSEDTWVRPDLDHLVIYELLIRDFIGSHSYVDLIDTLSYLKNLGVNAIELMPVSEFEGNDSWGYNPMTYFAVDKYYGTKDQLKEFIDKAHEMGMAVIMDMVLNHAYGLNPMVRMYWDSDNNNVSTDNPWFNDDYVGPYEWGYDFNHTSTYTQDFVDSVNTHWLRHYHFDGYRFDFTKGFTQSNSNFDKYNQERIDILKRMADKIWEEDQDAYVILEHWAPADEEEELDEYGMKMWRNRVHSFYDAMVGKTSGQFSDLSDLSHVVFVGSHDEERVAQQALTGGYTSEDGSYSVRSKAVYTERAKMVAAFNLLNPGPKMIWQFDELGYDISIDYNGRVGAKPLVWGAEGLGYYEDPLRKYIYEAYRGILDVRAQVDPVKMAAGSASHKLSGQVRRLIYNTDDIDLVLIGNFGVEAGSIDFTYPQPGDWYDYFSGEQIDVNNMSVTQELAAGEWHIYTSKRLSEGNPEVVQIVTNPVNVSPYPFTMTDEVTITFDPAKASNDGTDGLTNASQVYMHAGVILRGDEDETIIHEIGNLNDDGIGEMTANGDKWQIIITPKNYFQIDDNEDIGTIAMFFRDETNTNVGKGYRDEWVMVNVNSSIPIVSIEPSAFTSTDEITLTFNAAAGNGELANAEKIYIHAGVDLTNSTTPWVTGWQHVVGNWGEDDGIGEMTRSSENPDLWTLTLTPTDYFGINSSDFPKWISAVFRSADGNTKGTGQPGEFENGIIHENLDFFIENKGDFILAVDQLYGIKVYPNPVSSYLVIERESSQKVEMRILTFSGQLIQSLRLEDQRSELDVSGLSSGLYFIQLIENGHVQSFKLLKD
jgi:glycosidase